MNAIKIRRYNSPVGELLLGECGGKLCMCDWAFDARRAIMDCRICRRLNAEYEDEAESEVIQLAISQLNEYFDGTRTEFTIPLQFVGSEFQCRVWSALTEIPYGATVSYAELAAQVGNPKAVRAVASANAGNLISILVPCHRVIGSDGRLTGYAGGLDAKLRLLVHEARVCSKEISPLWSLTNSGD